MKQTRISSSPAPESRAAAEERFDRVVGADGLHSAVRRLAVGPESRFVTDLGLHVASVALDGTGDPAATSRARRRLTAAAE